MPSDNRRRFLLMVLVFLGIAGGIVAAQTFPRVPTRGLVLPCQTLVPEPVVVLFGEDGRVLFGCQPPIQPTSQPASPRTISAPIETEPLPSLALQAFKALANTTATPSFALPTPYTELWIVDFTGLGILTQATPCSRFPNQTPILLGPGRSVTFPPNMSTLWLYCAEYIGLEELGLSAFTVTWTVT